MKLSELKYPNMRAELLEHLHIIRKSTKEIEQNDFDVAIHFLFDDTPLSRQPEQAIGYFLLNGAECRAVADATSGIDRVLGMQGGDLDVGEVSRHPDWEAAIVKADHAYRLIASAG